ncbi:unnamed protein product [Absidia cylindrospora]
MNYNSLQSLPDELILSIFQYLKQENHLDLVPISSCCRRFQRLSSDYQLWNKMVMMDSSSSFMSSGNLIQLPLSSSHKKYQASEIVVIDPSDAITRGLRDLLTQNDPCRPLDLSIFTDKPFEYWALLADKPNLFRSISILPTQGPSSLSLSHPNNNNSDNIHSVDPFMYDIFNKMHPYLELLAFPRLSLHKLIHINPKKLTFPQIHTLNIGLSSLNDTGDSVIDWSKVKHTFPNLQDLTLHPLSIDKKEFWSIIRSLWSAPTLFPWLHSITIEANTFSSSSSIPPPIPSTNNITKDEITITLSRLKGLTRINTGTLDIVAVDQL